jgi:nucleotide-binding universal stress UspA family protein
MKTLLVPTDFSDSSDRALEVALDLAAQLGAAIELVHVQPDPVTVLPPPIEVATFTPGSAEESLHVAAELARRTEKVRMRRLACRSTNRFGNVAEQVVARADEIRAELVVMGTHGRTGLRHAVLGSVAEHVVQRSNRPVLVVPAGHRK